MAKFVKKSVIPIYAVGAVWLIFALFFSLYTLVDYLLCALASALAFAVAAAVFPNKAYDLPGPAGEEKKEESAPPKEEKPKSTGDPEIDELIRERERALGEMRRLNDSIQDEKISAQIDHLEQVTRKIIDHVVEQPKKLPQIRKFMNYYLPTTLKILNAYDRMSAAGISGTNIDTTKDKVEDMLETIVRAFDKQLDALFGDEALDISTDITVMENLLAQEGLSGLQMGADGK